MATTTTSIQRMVIEGKRYILIREAEYEMLCREAGRFVEVEDDELPALPVPDKQGRVKAIEYGRISLARDLIRQRKAAGMTQTELAKAAGVRQETISRLESGKHSVTTKTYDKIFRVLEKALKRKG